MPDLSPRQVAEQLNVSPTTVYRLIENGYVPAYRPGPRLLRVRSEDLEQIRSTRVERVERSWLE